VTKFLEDSFSSKAATDRYRDGWDRLWGDGLSEDARTVLDLLRSAKGGRTIKGIAQRCGWWRPTPGGDKRNKTVKGTWGDGTIPANEHRALTACQELEAAGLAEERMSARSNRWRAK